MRTVDVHKRRTHATVAGLLAEITDVVAGGRATMTIAIESEDAAALIAAVRGLHLDGYRNTSYPRGLAALLDDAPVRDAVIDVGTNSVKLVVGERTLDGGWRTVVDRGEVTRLGEGTDDEGTIAPKALERTARAVAAMADEARAADVRAIAAVGTAALRAANNADDVIAAIRARSGVSVEVISGEEESRLAYLSQRWRRSAVPAGRRSCSTPAAAVHSSPSAARARSRNGSACRSARPASRNVSAWTAL